MPFETGTATDHADLFSKLRTFLVAADPTGPAWTELDYDAVNNTAIFLAPGLSGTEEIHVGFGYVESAGTDAYALTGWMFRSYNGSLGHQSQPGHSGLGYHPLWDDSMTYWFIANGQRVIVVTKVSTVYTASYLGKFLPYGIPGEYPQPYYMSMPNSANTRWSSTVETFRNFFDPGDHTGSRMLNPNGSWYSVANFTAAGGGAESATSTNNYIWPFNAAYGPASTATTTRFRELRQNIDDTIPAWPLVLVGEVPSTDIYGVLDGAVAVSGFTLGSEDTVEIDGVDHLVVQNTFRTARYYYGAIKLE